MFRTLDAAKIVETLAALERRVGARFPESSLSRVAGELVSVARHTAAEAMRFREPILWLRTGTVLALGLGLAGQVWLARSLHVKWESINAVELTQGLEAAVNLLLLMVAAVWFLITLEERLKRHRVLNALHELRSLAHIIDMHQLTKDPTIILGGADSATAASPPRSMSEFELARYLDYCAELLALTGKLAALYADRARDPLVIGAVNEIEDLCTDLGRKIWQKIMILSQLNERRSS